MAAQFVLEFAAKTDVGLVRSHNEDAIAISRECGFAILADGMGGYNAGEVASGMATAVILEVLTQRLQHQAPDLRTWRGRQVQQCLNQVVVHANKAIFEAAQTVPEYSSMGTTLVLALQHHDKLTIAHVGDSRAYRLRDGGIEQLTRDHSLLQQQLDAGLITPEAAQYSPDKHLITRALGVAPQVDVEIHEHAVRAGDIYLLCSDGLTDMLSMLQVGAIMSAHGDDLDAACDNLIHAANDIGGHDNVSVVLIKIESANAKTEGLFGRLLHWM